MHRLIPETLSDTAAGLRGHHGRPHHAHRAIFAYARSRLRHRERGASGSHTIARTGHIVANTPTNPLLNPDGLTSLSDLAVGDAIHLSVTYDDADLETPGPVTNFLGETLVDPLLHTVGLGNGNPVNTVSLTVGSHSLQLSDPGLLRYLESKWTMKLAVRRGLWLMATR